MAILKNTTAWRGGSSTNRRRKLPGNVKIGPKSLKSAGKSVELNLSLPVTTGSSEVHVLIDEKDYVSVLRVMCDVDREAALLAMATVLADHLTDMKKVRDEAEERDREEPSFNLSSLSLPPKDGAAGP